MPQIIPAAMAAFAAIKSAVAVISAVKVLGVTLATWGKIAMWASMGASMLMKPPSLPSAGVQVSLQPAGPNAPLPIVFGRTGVQGFITYREAYPDAVHNSSKNNKLCFETVLSVGPVKSISNYTLTGHAIGWDRDPTRLGNSTGVSICRFVNGFDPKSSVWKDGVRAAFILGEHNDNRNLRSITGDAYLPHVSAIHGMAGLARIVQVFELDGSKNLRFPSGFPDKPQAVVEGVYAYDPRQDSTFPGGMGSQRIDQPSTWGWTENPYIAALAYALGRNGPTGQKMWGIGADPDDIDLPAFVHGANVADANGWKIGGLVTTDDSKDAVLSNLLVAGAGQYLPGPQISCFVNEPKVSTFTLRQSMLVGDQVIRATRPMKGRFNRILVKYREPNSNHEIVTGQEVSDAGFIAADGGLRTTETTYPLIQQATQAHQIAAYELVNGREYEVDVTTTAEALGVERGDMITLDFPIGAIESQNFIVKNWSFDAGQQTVSMTLVSETAGKHDFALGRTATAPAPAQLKSFASLNPSAPDATDWTLVANQIVQPRPVVEVEEGEEPPVPLEPVITPAFVFEGGATEPAISAVVVEMRPFDANRTTRLPSETDQAYADRQEEGWVIAMEAAPNSTRLIVSDVSPATTYDIAIRYRSNLGVTSPRLVYEGRETGNMSFDWNDPNVIIGVPPILRDLEGLAELQRLADGALTEGLETIGNAVTELEGKVTDLDELLDNTAGTVANAVSRLDGVWAVVGENDGTGLRRTVLELVENATGDNSEIVTRVSGLEQIVNAEGSQALARITDLDELETAIDGTYAKTTAVSGLQSQVTNQGTTISGLSTRLTTAETNINGRATVTDLNNLGSRVTTAEGNITATNTRLDTVETNVAGKASATQVGNLQTEINNARNGSANLSAQLGTMRQATTDGLAGKASVSDLTSLTGRVGTAENTITSHAGRLTSVETDVAGKASSSTVTTLSNEIVAARNGGTNLKSRIDGLQTSLTDAINLKASAQSVLDLQSEITNARGGQGTLSARFTQVNNSIVDGLAGKASAQSVTDLSASVNGFDARITSAANVAAQANGRASAIQGVVLDVNGLISGYSSVNNGTTSSFNVNANTFNLLTPGNPGDRIELTGTSGLKMFKNGVRRIMIGFA